MINQRQSPFLRLMNYSIKIHPFFELGNNYISLPYKLQSTLFNSHEVYAKYAVWTNFYQDCDIVFTALHVMQPRYGQEISVRLSVCPSHAWIVTKR